MARLFTRNDYIAGIRCPSLLWDALHAGGEGKSLATVQKLDRLYDKYALEQYIKKLDGCVVVDRQDFRKAEEYTKELLSDENIKYISGAAVSASFFTARCDLLRRKNDGSFALCMVRSGTHIRQSACHDASYQIFLLNTLAVSITTVEYIRINGEYVAGGHMPMFCTDRATSRVMSLTNGVEARLERMLKAALSDTPPKCQAQNSCFEPFECERREKCFGDLPKNNIFDVGGLRKQTKFRLYQEGKVSLDDAAEDQTVPENIRRQIREAIEGGEPAVRMEELSAFMNTLWFPMCFLDFESTQPSVPVYEGTRPFESLAFQFSLHIMRSPNMEPEHISFIAPAGDDPRELIAEKLCEHIPRGACVVAYNMQLERQTVSALSKRFPQYKEHLCEMCRNMRDMMTPFLKGYYHDPKMNGSYSLKKVLAALYPNDEELDYKQLNLVHNGQEAQAVYSMACLDKTIDVSKLYVSLEKYCSLDTYALYKLYQKLSYACGIVPKHKKKVIKLKKTD